MFLFIDTSTERSIVGLGRGSAAVAFRQLPVGLNNSRMLHTAILDCLSETKVEVGDLAFIACANGPGSYTGLRVGAITAKAAAYALRRPLVAVSSLRLYRPAGEGVYATLIDAKVSGAYAIKGRVDGDGAVTFTCEPQLLAIESVDAFLSNVDILLSPSFGTLKDKLTAWHERCHWCELYPDAALFAALAYEQYRLGCYTTDATLSIQYMR